MSAAGYREIQERSSAHFDVEILPGLSKMQPYTKRFTWSSDGKRARSVVALASNLHLVRSRFLTGLTAVFVARLHETPAWQGRTLILLICRHHLCSPDLPSLQHPANQCSRGDAGGKRRRSR